MSYLSTQNIKTQPADDRVSFVRQEQNFAVISGVFLVTVSVMNILGTTRFITLPNWLNFFSDQLTQINIPIGVLLYPITFMCTDLISELYGAKRATKLVWLGFYVNIALGLFIWLVGLIPPVPAAGLNEIANLPDSSHPDYAFYRLRYLTLNGLASSMVAYLVAQLIDVKIFHYLKKLTKNKHLWLRNNLSTLTSQLVDTIIVTSLTYWLTSGFLNNPLFAANNSVLYLIVNIYLLKAIIALLDTFVIYLLCNKLKI